MIGGMKKALAVRRGPRLVSGRPRYADVDPDLPSPRVVVVVVVVVIQTWNAGIVP
jgi:hypothetical protein